MFAVSFVVFIEPAPCDLIFALVLVVFARTGLKIHVATMPLLGLLLLYNLGGLASAAQVLFEPKVIQLISTSSYMAVTAVFFANFVAADPATRVDLIKKAYIFGASFAAVTGLLGYFNVGGLGSLFMLNDRAVGAFKDPNVFSTYLIFPAVALVQGFMLGTHKQKFFCAIAAALILPALFLAFSRGAWINVSLSITLMVVMTFILTHSNAMRGRIIIFTILGIAIVAAGVAVLLMIPAIRDLAMDRFTLVKNYDGGETGRFGRQLIAIPLLLGRPLGFGPTQFAIMLGEDPHNTFLNAFSSYGWLGGVTYFALVVCNIAIGFRTIIVRSAWQNQSILVFACFLAVTFQGVQIDTEHWRHFYWLLGMLWGNYAATLRPEFLSTFSRRDDMHQVSAS